MKMPPINWRWMGAQLSKGALQAVGGMGVYLLAALVLVHAFAGGMKSAITDAVRWKSPLLADAVDTRDAARE